MIINGVEKSLNEHLADAEALHEARVLDRIAADVRSAGDVVVDEPEDCVNAMPDVVVPRGATESVRTS